MWLPFLPQHPHNHSHNGHHHHHTTTTTTSRVQQIQLLVIGLCLICILPTRLFLKSQKWRFSSLGLPLEEAEAALKKNSKTAKKLPIINNTAECRYFPEALFQLTNSLHDNPEQYALRPWKLLHAGPKYPAWHFPGLSSQLLQTTFGGKHVVLTGDSTLFYLVRWMQTLYHNVTLDSTNKLDDMWVDTDMTVANYALNPDMDWQVGWADDTLPQVGPLKDGTHIAWFGHRGDSTTPGKDACTFEPLWDHVRVIQPHIWMVNFGLHWLHLEGEGRDVPLCYVQAWLQYEDFLEQVVRVARESNVKLLLFKTTNKICTDHFRGDYADGVARYQRPDTSGDALTKCHHLIRDLIPSYAQIPTEIFSAKNVKRYCQKAVMDEFGVKDLNHRLLEFVQHKQRQLVQEDATNNLTIAIYNDHDLQSCTYSAPEDGRHYHPLNLMRIRLLGNMIQCLYPHDDDANDKDHHNN